MNALSTLFDDPVRRRAVALDGARLVDDQVRSARGLRAAALRAGYRTVRKLRPDFVEDALDHLLPRFGRALDPLYDAALETDDPRGYLLARRGDVADALLGVTDELAKNSVNRVLKRAYGALRGHAREHVLTALPPAFTVMERHVGKTP